MRPESSAIKRTEKPAVNLSSGLYAVPHAKNSGQHSFTIPDGEKKQKHQEASRPILDAFWAWVEKSALASTSEKLTQALGYSKNQKEYL